MPASSLQTAFSDPSSYGTTLLMAAVDEFGHDVLSWSAETVRMEVEEACGGMPMWACYARLMAAICITTCDAFYNGVAEFNGLCRVLSGESVRPDDPEPADAGSIACGIVEAALLSPPDDGDDEPYSSDVRRFMGVVLDADGFGDAVPDVLQLAIRRPRHGPTDDHEAEEAARAVQEVKRTEILQLLSDGMKRLADQLGRLPLKNGSADELRDRLAAAAGRRTQRGD